MRATASEAEGSRGHLGGQAEGLAVGLLAADALWPGASPLPMSVRFPTPPLGSVLPVGPAAQVLCGLHRLSGTALPSPPGSLLAHGEGLPDASLSSPHKDAACSLLKSKYKTRPRPCP